MFGKNNNHKENGSHIETMIGSETVVQGTISSKGSLRIDGKVEGGVTEADCVVLGQKGEIQGDVTARSLVIGGKLVGNISANAVEILTEAHIHGDIKTSALSIAEGASFEGNCTMTKEQHVIEMDLSKAGKSRK